VLHYSVKFTGAFQGQVVFLNTNTNPASLRLKFLPTAVLFTCGSFCTWTLSDIQQGVLRVTQHHRYWTSCTCRTKLRPRTKAAESILNRTPVRALLVVALKSLLKNPALLVTSISFVSHTGTRVGCWLLVCSSPA